VRLLRRERRCRSLRSQQVVFADKKRNKEFEEWGNLVMKLS